MKKSSRFVHAQEKAFTWDANVCFKSCATLTLPLLFRALVKLEIAFVHSWAFNRLLGLVWALHFSAIVSAYVCLLFLACPRRYMPFLVLSCLALLRVPMCGSIGAILFGEQSDLGRSCCRTKFWTRWFAQGMNTNGPLFPMLRKASDAVWASGLLAWDTLAIYVRVQRWGFGAPARPPRSATVCTFCCCKHCRASSKHDFGSLRLANIRFAHAGAMVDVPSKCSSRYVPQTQPHNDAI